jgi:uncharacterized membrane protein
MKATIAIGLTVIAGAALVEVALVPAVIVGGAAVLAPRYLPKLRRLLQSAVGAAVRQSAKPSSAAAGTTRSDRVEAQKPLALPADFGLKQAVFKTITYRLIVTTLDFTTNYVVIGELTTAAGLSTFNLVAGPLFYLAHEAGWNYLGPPEDASVNVPFGFTLPAGGKTVPARLAGVTISRALAKTITFRTFATIMDFTTNYVVVRDVATAAGLSAFGFVLGPFVYYGHEKLWDYYGSRDEPASDLGASPKLLPAPAAH